MPNAGRNANGSTVTTKRRGGANNNNRGPTPLSSDYPSASLVPSHRPGANGLPASNSHPSSSSNLSALYANGTSNNNNGPVLANGNAAHYYEHPHSLSATPDLNSSSAAAAQQQLLAGPGVPFARSASVHSTVTNTNGNAGGGGRNGSAGVGTMSSVADGGNTEAGDNDGDNDDGRTYCYCDGVSYGEMIACDDENCEREWVGLVCFALFFLVTDLGIFSST